MENSMDVSLKIKSGANIWPRNPSSEHLPEKFENVYSWSYMYLYVHYSIIHNSLDMQEN